MPHVCASQQRLHTPPPPTPNPHPQPPSAHKVKEAMNDINAAQRLRVAALEKAEASKIRVVKEAEADAEAKYLHGSGVARQRQVGGGRGRRWLLVGLVAARVRCGQR
jgi:hypothetical protein